MNSIWLGSCKIYYTYASLLWVFLFHIKYDSRLDCTPRPSALSEAVLFHQQSPDRQHCLSNERKAISQLDLALLCGSFHALGDVVLDFFPSVGQVLFLVDATLSLARDINQSQENYFPPNQSGRTLKAALGPHYCPLHSYASKGVKKPHASGVLHDERVQRRCRPGRRRTNVLKEPKLF